MEWAEIINLFLEQVIIPVLGLIVTGILGYVFKFIKNRVDNEVILGVIEDIEDSAYTAVMSVKSEFKYALKEEGNLEEAKNKAVNKMRNMLDKKTIKIINNNKTDVAEYLFSKIETYFEELEE